MPPSKLDIVYRKLLITRFFEKGWGKPENLQRLFEFRKILSQREACYKLIPSDYHVNILKKEKHQDCVILEGKFITPLELYLPGVVPKAAQQAQFQAILPNKWNHEELKPMCIHLAGTGDHFYWRRRNFIAKPLLKEANIGAIILENPFYGVRKPDNQVRSNLHNVSDIFVMGGCLILECIALFHWCEKNGFGPIGVTGLSMGGHMASLVATNWPKPLVLVPCLSWSSAAAVFTTGVMSQSINWDMLESQYYADGRYRENLSKMVTVIDDAFTAGQKFVKNFDQSLKELEKDIDDSRRINFIRNVFYSAKTKPIDTSNNHLNSVGFVSLHQNKSTEENAETNNKYFGNQTVLLPNSEKSPLTRLMRYILPHSSPAQSEKINIAKTNWWEREALQFMRGMMDECTHLKNFSVPYDTSLIIVVCARDDAYVPREGCSSLEDIWPGVEIRYLDAGHVSAYVLHQKLFRSCIIEAFRRAKDKMQNPEYRIGENLKSELSYAQLLENYTHSI